MSGLTDPSMAADGAGLVITGSRSGIPVVVHATISTGPEASGLSLDFSVPKRVASKAETVCPTPGQ